MAIEQWEFEEQPVSSEKMRRLSFSVADVYADLATIPVGERLQGKHVYCLENNRLYEWDTVVGDWGPPPGVVWTASANTGINGRPPAKLGARCYRTDVKYMEVYDGTTWVNAVFYALPWTPTLTQGVGFTLSVTMAEAVMRAGKLDIDFVAVITAGTGSSAGQAQLSLPAGITIAGTDRILGRVWFTDVSAGTSPVGDVTDSVTTLTLSPGFVLGVGDAIRVTASFRPS